MDFLDDINEKTLLLVEDDIKEKILENLNQKERLINLKVMTKQEFLTHYFYDYNDETIHFVALNYNTTINNAKVYLDNMKYVLNLDLANQKVQFLKQLYHDLKKKNLLIFDDFFKDYLKSFSIKVLLTTKLDNFFKNLLEPYNVTYQEVKVNKLNEHLKVNHFIGIDEEVAFIFSKIATLISNGIPINHIKLTNVTSEYIPYLKRMSKFYHLKINNLEKYPIYGTVTIKKLLKMITSKKSKSELLEVINKNLDKDIYGKFFNIINRFYFTEDLEEVLDDIKEYLKKTTLDTKKYQNAIEIIPLNSFLTTKEDYVFLMGFNLENIPKTYLDIDYLSDDLKSQIGLFKSLEKNKNEKEEILFHLKNFPNLTISYKDTTPLKTYFPSLLVEDMEIQEPPFTPSTFSNLYNQITLTKELDTLLKYGSSSPNLSLLLTTYPDIPYLTYENKFKGLSKTFDKITLSYTSLNNYYHCAFRYYIDNILKLNIYEDSFKIYIGNLFHYVLSKMFEPNFSFEDTYNDYLKERTFTEKEKFYLEILKEELQEVIEIIRYQHNLSGLNKVYLEKEIKLEIFPNFIFKGFIDKIMYQEKNAKTYLSLIDYKTGTPKTDMTNLKYGIDMQLPIYLYLITKSNLFENPVVIGFYFEQIIHEKSNYNKDKNPFMSHQEKLKLNGYTIDSEYLVSLFDTSYQNSELIKSMKLTSNGFSKNAKVISEESLKALIEQVDLKVKEAFKEIKKANFSINPKVIGGSNIGCLYCKYQDLCFKTGKDFVYLDKMSDLSYLEGEKEDA